MTDGQVEQELRDAGLNDDEIAEAAVQARRLAEAGGAARGAASHQCYGKATLRRDVTIGDETTCMRCGRTFTIGMVWVA